MFCLQLCEGGIDIGIIGTARARVLGQRAGECREEGRGAADPMRAVQADGETNDSS